MNSGPTSQRVHDAIKRRILTRVFHPGQRLDPAALAETLSSSVTPVRDALHLLAGRELVVTGTSEGFHIPHLDEPGLKDLYAWNVEVLQLAIRAWPRQPTDAQGRNTPPEAADPASATAALFMDIGELSDNAEHAGAIGALNDRLHAIRIVEAGVIEACDDEFQGLAAAATARDPHA
ncbi:MAG: GntR family transcriptional regulator, partial [Sphingomonadaceae bacterium]|nr:GntR family transcriptional regulator [Sphingomonadaceae bacterium]